MLQQEQHKKIIGLEQMVRDLTRVHENCGAEAYKLRDETHKQKQQIRDLEFELKDRMEVYDRRVKELENIIAHRTRQRDEFMRVAQDNEGQLAQMWATFRMVVSRGKINMRNPPPLMLNGAAIAEDGRGKFP
jgi:phosphoglycerate-specific signal transduction histidine kinase